MLKQRILTALVLIPIVLGILFYAPYPVFEGAAAVLMLLGAWEWSKLMGLSQRYARLLYLALIALLLALVYWWEFTSEIVLVIGGVWWSLITLTLIYLVYQKRALTLPAWLVGISGIFTIVPCWVGLSILRTIPSGNGDILILLLLLCVWGADTGAYFSGRFFGRHKLAPLISPKKTWEGCYGGAVTIALVISIYGLLENIPGYGLIAWLGVGLLILVVSIVGDLFESLLKRGRSIKDSGQLLPGHGGILDRLDSLFAAAPVFALSIIIFGEQLLP
jgi:phosphatidate cytidylyltransferase